MNLRYLTTIAIAAAQSAGQIIQSYAHKKVTVQNKESCTSLAYQVVTEVDVA